jgi:hypothetical protein
MPAGGMIAWQKAVEHKGQLAITEGSIKSTPGALIERDSTLGPPVGHTRLSGLI